MNPTPATPARMPGTAMSPAPEPSALEGRAWILPALIAAATFLLYSGSLRFQFVYDDRMQILDNPLLLSWQYLGKLFTSNVWAFAGPAFPANYWRPLFMVWLLINHTLFGFNPAGWHFAAVLCHVGASLLVYKLGRRLLGDGVTAALAALLFAVHPALIESVAWVSGATDSLLALFFLPAFLCYLEARRSGARAKLAASLALYALALLVKETAIMLPLLVFVYAGIYHGEPGRSRWAERIWAGCLAALPYLAVSGLYLAARLHALGEFAQGQSPATAGSMLLTWPSLLGLYARLLVYPAGISPYYNEGLVTQFSTGRVLAPGLILLAAAAGLGWWARAAGRGEPAGGEGSEGRLVAFASAWMLIPLLPVLYLRVLPVADFAHARYLYLPAMGFSLLVALGLRHLRVGQAQILSRAAAPTLACLGLAMALAVGNAVQQIHWATDLLLFSRGAEIAPQNPGALTNLGMELAVRHYPAQAVTVLRRALALYPDNWHANYNLGYTFMLQHQYTEAEPYLEQAIRIAPFSAEQFAYLGVAEMELGNLQEAEGNLRQAIQRSPRAHHYHYVLGMILEKQGRKAEAQEQYRAELSIDPKDADARKAVGAGE